jgi:hypothetical protein
MTFKIMISVSDEIKDMIDEYNRINKYRKLPISGICQEALYDFLSNALPKKEPIKKNLEATPQDDKKQPILEDSDKPTIPCPICGTMFVQTIPTRKFCSKNCGTQASRMRKKTQDN